MLGKHLIFGIFFFALLMSCNRATVEGVPVPAEPPTRERGVLATAVQEIVTPLPVMVTVTRSTAEPRVSPILPILTETVPAATRIEAATDAPRLAFSDLRFALTADGAVQSEFMAGTEEIYALWEYRGMSPADSVRRIWFRDDQIWLTREEDWDWGEYGSEGTMRDISVYDNEGSGLVPARYRLQLYVNDVLQQEAMFAVLAP